MTNMLIPGKLYRTRRPLSVFLDGDGRWDTKKAYVADTLVYYIDYIAYDRQERQRLYDNGDLLHAQLLAEFGLKFLFPDGHVGILDFCSASKYHTDCHCLCDYCTQLKSTTENMFKLV